MNTDKVRKYLDDKYHPDEYESGEVQKLLREALDEIDKLKAEYKASQDALREQLTYQQENLAETEQRTKDAIKERFTIPKIMAWLLSEWRFESWSDLSEQSIREAIIEYAEQAIDSAEVTQ